MKKKLIGRGSFTKAYLREDGKVLLVSRCPIKECMAMGWFPDSPLFPELERIGAENNHAQYLMEYLPRPRSLKQNLDPDQWQIYKDLKGLADSVTSSNRMHDYFSIWHKQFDKLEDPELRETMKDALDACANFGSDIGFEISPRNVSAKDGKLILLDCFFQFSMMKRNGRGV